MVGWLAGELGGGLVGWLAGGWAGWAGRLAGWQEGRLVGDWIAGWVGAVLCTYTGVSNAVLAVGPVRSMLTWDTQGVSP